MDIGALIATAVAAVGGLAGIAAWITKLWKGAKKFKLVEDIFDGISDGELTAEELEKIVTDIKALVK